MIKDINALGGVVEIHKTTLVTDDGRVGDGIEQLPEVRGLIHQRSIVADTFEDGVELVEHPDIVVIGQPDGLCLQDIQFTEIDGIDDVEEAVQLDNGRELAVIDQDLERVGDIDAGDLPETADIIEDREGITLRPELLQPVILVQDIDIAQ